LLVPVARSADWVALVACPAQFAAGAPRTTVSYGGAKYVINNDNTMSRVIR
jgi:hypothetical protein